MKKSATPTHTTPADTKLFVHIIGEENTGRQTLLKQIKQKNGEDSTFHTLGMDFAMSKIKVDSQQIQLGTYLQHPRQLASANKAMPIFFLLYDVTNRRSFEIAKQALESKAYPNYGFPVDHTQTCIILTGNKCDDMTSRVVTTKEGENLAQQFGIPFFEISALTGHQVDQLLTSTARYYLKDYENGAAKEVKQIPNILSLIKGVEESLEMILPLIKKGNVFPTDLEKRIKMINDVIFNASNCINTHPTLLASHQLLKKLNDLLQQLITDNKQLELLLLDARTVPKTLLFSFIRNQATEWEQTLTNTLAEFKDTQVRWKSKELSNKIQKTCDYVNFLKSQTSQLWFYERSRDPEALAILDKLHHFAQAAEIVLKQPKFFPSHPSLVLPPHVLAGYPDLNRYRPGPAAAAAVAEAPVDMAADFARPGPHNAPAPAAAEIPVESDIKLSQQFIKKEIDQIKAEIKEWKPLLKKNNKPEQREEIVNRSFYLENYLNSLKESVAILTDLVKEEMLTEIDELQNTITENRTSILEIVAVTPPKDQKQQPKKLAAPQSGLFSATTAPKDVKEAKKRVTQTLTVEQLEKIEEALMCAISTEILADPHSIVSGHTYSKAEIEDWFSKGQKTNPGNNEPLADNDTRLFKNELLANIVSTFAKLKEQYQDKIPTAVFADTFRPLLTCPITKEIMTNPIMLAGHQCIHRDKSAAIEPIIQQLIDSRVLVVVQDFKLQGFVELYLSIVQPKAAVEDQSAPAAAFD